MVDILKNIIGDKYYAELDNAKQSFGSHSCVEKENDLFVLMKQKEKIIMKIVKHKKQDLESRQMEKSTSMYKYVADHGTRPITIK